MEDERQTKEILEDALRETIENYNCQTTASDARDAEALNVTRLTSALAELRTMEAEEKDREEKRRIEEEKNAANLEIEAEKAKTPWGRICFEAGAKVVMQIIDHTFFGVRQRQILEFEEHGVIRSKASKDLGFRFPWSKK